MAKRIEESRKFLSQLKRHEGKVVNSEGLHIAYYCPAGKLTIGYGHNLTANPIKGVNKYSKLTEEDAMTILAGDCSVIARTLDSSLYWWRSIGEARSAVLLNMAFNMGVASLLTFKATLRYILDSKFDDAANEMLVSRWAGQVGRRAVELSYQMRTGEWQKELPRHFYESDE